jgi:hypothetical protein
MKDITYKYNVGDYVKFKDKFHSPTCGLVGREGTIAKITGHAFAYNNRPHYYINDIEGEVFTETCFAGLATESEFLAQQALGSEVDKEQVPETECDVDDSGESESKWYHISFSAKLSPDDLRAMKKCFFDAMNESMEIYDLENLVIEEA